MLRKGLNINTDVIFTSLERNIAQLKSIFADDATIGMRWITNCNDTTLKYCIVQNDGLVDSKIINNNIIKPLISSKVSLKKGEQIDVLMHQVISINQIKKTTQWKEIIESVTYGDSILFIDGEAGALILNSKSFSTRGITEPSNEKVLLGPREGFSEALMTNLSMVKRKIRNNDLKMKFQSFGVQTHTQICICYLDNIVNKKVLEELYRRLETINIDGVLDSHYITEFIQDSKLSPVNTIGYTERPDVVVGKLLEGRIALFVDGSPVVLTLPYLFIENFQSNEDYYLNYYYASLSRILRIFGFILSVTLPAFYLVTVAFNQEVYPTTLLINLVRERTGAPLPAVIELIVMLILFEILKETGIRIPTGIGQALSIVGAIVVGQAAVAAKLVAAPMLIVVALTAISGFLVPKMNASIIYGRTLLILLSSTFGLLGFVIGCSMILTHLLNLHSFGIPQIISMDNMKYQEVKDTFIRGPWWKMIKRPSSLTENKKRLNGDKGECN
ncbi:spore germination protein [Anaerosinus gibii]|uniref:Spore germination protein n=1 Tax=Selenobaculum gibii TaxID=3054208 RepID=A0A9Y2AK96_9FIRM|nr:spore germination protein [Selenobaculum gbiensis]WIW71278.1 spore germination protein [Selenobaculum gbiensis]